MFHMRIYLYETSRNIQEPWPSDLYFMVCWLQTLADFPWLIFSSQVDSWALLMVASWYFTRGFTSLKPAVSAFMPSVHALGWGWRSISRTLVLQHRLEIMIEHRLESVDASDAILPIIIGCWISLLSMHVHVCFPALCFVLYIISDVIDLH